MPRVPRSPSAVRAAARARRPLPVLPSADRRGRRAAGWALRRRALAGRPGAPWSARRRAGGARRSLWRGAGGVLGRPAAMADDEDVPRAREAVAVRPRAVDNASAGAEHGKGPVDAPA